MDHLLRNRGSWLSSNLGRALDPTYKTNMAVILLTLAAGAATAALSFLHGRGITTSLLSAGRIGLYLFLCWALTREIDPDHEGAAFLSMGVGLALLATGAEPSLLTGFWLLGLLRTLNRTPGRPATHLDTLILVVASLGLAWWQVWIYGAVGGMLLTLDGFLAKPAMRHRSLGGLLVVASLAMELTRSGPSPAYAYPSDAVWMILAVSLLLVPLVLGSKRIKSHGDASGEVLNAPRIQATQVSLLVVAILLLARVEDGWAVSIVEWAVLVGAGAWYAGAACIRSLRAFMAS